MSVHADVQVVFFSPSQFSFNLFKRETGSDSHVNPEVSAAAPVPGLYNTESGYK